MFRGTLAGKVSALGRGPFIADGRLEGLDREGARLGRQAGLDDHSSLVVVPPAHRMAGVALAVSLGPEAVDLAAPGGQALDLGAGGVTGDLDQVGLGGGHGDAADGPDL